MRIITRINQDLPLSAETIGYDWTQPEISRPNGYPFFHWLQTQEGQGIIEVGHETFKLKKGAGFLLSPGVAHKYYPVGTKEWKTSFLTFGAPLADEIVHFIFASQYVWVPEKSASLNNFIPDNADSFLTDDYTATLKQSGLIYQFLMLLNNKTATKSSQYSKTEVIYPITEFITHHYSETITNKDLERVTNFSVSYGTKIFKEYFGLTPQQYLTDFRLRKAKELLIEAPELQVQDVAALTGFKDVSYFIKIFRQANKVTPYGFKNRHE